MSTTTVNELRAKSDAAAANLARQLRGMETSLERAEAPGQWTVREVLCHLLFKPDFEPVALLRTFATTELPVVEIPVGVTEVTPERKTMTLKDFAQALEAQRHQVFEYLETLSDAELGCMARIPLFKQLMGTHEITVPVFVGAMFEYHWNDHAGQIAKIRSAAGLLPAA
jgi:DinB superfamily